MPVNIQDAKNYEQAGKHEEPNPASLNRRGVRTGRRVEHLAQFRVEGDLRRIVLFVPFRVVDLTVLHRDARLDARNPVLDGLDLRRMPGTRRARPGKPELAEEIFDAFHEICDVGRCGNESESLWKPRAYRHAGVLPCR